MCLRCEDTGQIHTWGGRINEGGMTGPCPECRTAWARRFVEHLNPFALVLFERKTQGAGQASPHGA